jgi:ribonuclease ZC3H12
LFVSGGVIISNNNFKKYLNHNDEFKLVIEERVLMYSFIDETFMPDENPLGKNGPSLENFLRIEQSMNSSYFKKCPYKKKCTYGAKCKFLHPERGNLKIVYIFIHSAC